MSKNLTCDYTFPDWPTTYSSFATFIVIVSVGHSSNCALISLILTPTFLPYLLVDIAVIEYFFQNPLPMAACRGHIGIMKDLVEKKPDVNIKADPGVSTIL